MNASDTAAHFLAGLDAIMPGVAVITFTRRRVVFDEWDRVELGATLVALGRKVMAGPTFPTGTVIVPFPERRLCMRVKMDLRGPKGKMWNFEMGYDNLPEGYASEIGLAASAFASYIENHAGQAAGSDPKYNVTFSYQGEGDGAKYKGSAKQDDLLYSQAVDFQNAGIALLGRLLSGAHMEIVAGQRK